MNLPPALAPWSEELAHLEPGLVPALGEMMRHLDAAIGPYRKHREACSGEPEGFDGLSHKGSYEHLLPSEWLLAELWPNEFLRRAVNGEHLFLKRGFRHEFSHKASVLLVDCGPAQLGAPRLVHLALILVMARRAKQTGASFYWGILQAPEVGLYAYEGLKDLRRFMDVARWETPTADHLRTWKKCLKQQKFHEDVWSIGGPRHPKIGAHHVVVSDPLCEGRPSMDVVFHRPAGHYRLELVLPKPEVCRRLLQSPLRSQQVLISADGLHLGFSLDGRRLALCAQNRAFVFSPPNSPNGLPGRTRISRFKERLVGIGSYTNRFVYLTHDGQHYGFSRRPKQICVPASETLANRFLDTTAWCHIFFSRHRPPITYDPIEGQLISWVDDMGRLLGQKVTRVFQINDELVYTTKEDGLLTHTTLNAYGEQIGKRETSTDRDLAGFQASNGQEENYLAQQNQDGWQIIRQGRTQRYDIPTDQQVRGLLTRGPFFRSGGHLVSSTADGCIFIHLDNGKHRRIAENAKPEYMVPHPSSGQVAWIDQHDTLQVYSLPYSQILFSRKLEVG